MSTREKLILMGEIKRRNAERLRAYLTARKLG